MFPLGISTKEVRNYDCNKKAHHYHSKILKVYGVGYFAN